MYVCVLTTHSLGLFVSVLLICGTCLHLLDIVFGVINATANISLHSAADIFTLLMVSFVN